MNTDTLIQQLQKGFRVTLGATASLVEALQDPQKREENIAKLSQEWSQLSEDWEEKGAMTEQEARSFVDTLIAQQNNQSQPSPETSRTTTVDAPSAPPDIQLELQELTAQIAAIRTELEKLREQNSPS